MSSSEQQYPYRHHQEGYGGGEADPDVAQTWEGQTWDTHYQPVVQPQGYPQQQPPPAVPGTGQYPPPQQAAPASAPPAYDAPTAYLPPVTGRQPAPAAAPGFDAPTAYLPPVTDQQPAPGQAPASAPVPSYAYEPQAQPLPEATPSAPEPAPEPAPAAGPGPSYNPPTTMGNARITDAQRARAEGRSPIIEPGIQPAGLTALLGLLLAGGAAIGPYALLVPLVLLQAVTAAGWFRLNGMWPARQGIALAFLGGVVADAALLVAGREHAPAAILGTLGVWVLLVLVLQLRSHAAAEERMYGLMATVASSALAVVAAGFLAASAEAAVVGALAVGAAAVARA
uniref:hypothetical protein n=1 Tax=Streptomyces sp. TRM64462 TaxID=2741726 RepID=UPI0020C807DE